MTAAILFATSSVIAVWALRYWWRINAIVAEARGEQLFNEFLARVRESSNPLGGGPTVAASEGGTHPVAAVSGSTPRPAVQLRGASRPERLIPAWVGAR